MSRLKWLSMNHNALSTGLPGVEFIAPPHEQASTLDTLGDRRCLHLIGFAVLKEESSSFLRDQGKGSLKGTVLRPDRGTGDAPFAFEQILHHCVFRIPHL
jgi:hypothetical protein